MMTTWNLIHKAQYMCKFLLRNYAWKSSVYKRTIVHVYIPNVHPDVIDSYASKDFQLIMLIINTQCQYKYSDEH